MSGMKKNEILILAVLVLAACGVILFMKLGSGSKDKTAVEIRYYSAKGDYTVVKEFDPSVDAVYHVDGNYGGLEVEVKDGRWHVINAICPNHDCEGMGWASPGEIMPITCLPNSIVVIEKTE